MRMSDIVICDIHISYVDKCHAHECITDMIETSETSHAYE